MSWISKISNEAVKRYWGTIFMIFITFRDNPIKIYF